MAQYYNFVTNASGTLTVEDVQRICSLEGQSVQFVVEDINNDGNGSQQILTYTAAPQNSEQAIFSQQTVNLGSQISTTQLEQGQNVFIIKTNNLSTSQNVLKTTAVDANAVGENIVSTVDNRGSKASANSNNDGRQIQWIKMQENSITLNAVSKQNPIISEKSPINNLNRNQLQNNTSPQTQLHGHCVGSVGAGLTKRKPLRLYQNRNRQSTNSIQTGSSSVTPDGVNATSPGETKIQNSNVSNIRTSLPSFRNKAISPLGQNVTQISTQQNQRQAQNDQRSQSSNAQQTSLNNPAQRQQGAANTVHQKQQQLSSASQLQQLQKPASLSSSPQNMHSSMDIESPDYSSQERGQSSQQCSPSQTDPENSATESIAYLQKIIDNPANTIVQHQIQGNTAKMLVMLSNGEQRLITFDIPNEDCTVQDLLEQANITFCGETIVSLVSDPALGINYIVEAGPGTLMTSHEISETSEVSSSQSTANTNFDNSSHTISSPDGNSSPMQQSETFYKKNDRILSGKLDKLDREGSACKRGRGRGRGVASRPKSIHKEPECLTISSDEEEEGKNRKADGPNNSIRAGDTSNNFTEEMDAILEKEPVITNNSVSSTVSDYTPESEDSAKDNSIQAPHTSLLCRTVRIGSYKYIPRERVVISQNGVRFGVPLLEDDKNFVTLDVKFQDIIKVLIHFGKSMPVLFFYTSTSTGAMIRELLGMQDPKGPYYDPAGKDHTHKRITLLPEKLTEESKVVLKNLFAPRELLEELNPKEANEILVRASPKDSLQIQSLSKRQSQASASSSANTNVNGGIQTITVYPPPPAKGGIAINTEDYLCLGEDQFLNDVIIDFYLKYLTLEVLSESDQQRTHVFSSYFYKRLTSPHAQAAESNASLTPAAKRHARVQKWTKNVNIFEKDFIIIPINEHAHWFLAIICFPGLVGKVSTNTTNATAATPPKEDDVHKTVQKSKKLKELKLQAVTIGSTTITPVTTTTITIDEPDDGSERDEAEGDDEEMEMDSDDDEDTETTEETKNQQVKLDQNVPQEKDTVKLPCILIFDSLAGASRARVVATLRDYLSCEHVAKMDSEEIFSKDTIKGASLKVPQQSNFTDCGLYVLQYVESFFKNPIKDYTLPIKTLKSWFEEIVVTRKREELSKLLIKLMNSTKGDKNINLPVVNFPTQDGKLKVKSENHVDMKPTKSELESKKKPTLDGESRISNNSMPTPAENTEPTNEIINRTTYQIIPFSPCTSSNSTESKSTEMLTEPKTSHVRSPSETMSYLKSKRIPRLMLRTENQDDSQAAKKHKGESFDSCK